MLYKKTQDCDNGNLTLKPQMKCENCHKCGHTKEKCWAKGGGAEGKRPNGREKTNKAQATNDALEEDAAYHTTNTAYTTRNKIIMQHDWLADSGTTSHITCMREMFNKYTPLEKAEIKSMAK